MNKQFTLRGMIIGALGSVVLTTSSMYVALKLGALPWPIIFVALVSMFALKAFGNTNLNEINVTHTAMSAGAMVAGGVAFTVPGIFILNPEAELSWTKLLFITLAGVVLGLISTGLIRHHFIEEKDLPLPMGQAAAETVTLGDEGGKKAGALFASLGASGLFTFLRDGIGVIPATVTFSKGLVTLGVQSFVWLSPMLISVGYIVGPVSIGVWFLGALLGDMGIVVAGPAIGLWDAATASDIKTSLGIGVMIGCGLAILIKHILPNLKWRIKNLKSDQIRTMDSRFVPVGVALCVLLLTVLAKLPVVASLLLILGAFLACCMSSQIVGVSGINPMEVFGVIIMLLIRLVSSLDNIQAFYVAAVVAVAAGLCGDVMNDFKAGKILGSNPGYQWKAEAIGGLIGAFVSTGVFYVVLTAYGSGAFGAGGMFPAPQAGVVAAMVGGIPNMPAFLIGLAAGVILYLAGLPVMTLGLGIYLPFYLSVTAAIGGLLRFIVNKRFAEKAAGGEIIASGCLGGEAVVGVIIALVQAISAIGSM